CFDLPGRPSFSLFLRQVCRSALFPLEASPRHLFRVRRRVEDTARELGERSLLPMVFCVQTWLPPCFLVGGPERRPPYRRCGLVLVSGDGDLYLLGLGLLAL